MATTTIIPKRSPTLQDDQKFALMKFRRMVADILTKPEHDDFFLIRWLNARNWNPEAAEKMLRESIKNRERWGVDKLESWNCPQILKDNVPVGISGYDKEGSPIVIIPFAGMDMWGMLHTVSRADFIRMAVLTLERYMKIAFEQSKLHGPQARQFVVLFDMEGFNLKQYVWRPAGEVVIMMIKNYESNYPEILKSCYIINVPKIFAFAFNIIKRFLDEYTLSKIMIYKSHSKKWLPKLLEGVDESQIPEYYGGTLTDPDGNPKCKTKINWGGKVPVSMYMDKTDGFLQTESLNDTVVRKGSKIKLQFKAKETGSFLKWGFRTFDHDIRFGVKRIHNETAEENEEIALRRVASHQVDEEGFIPCHPEYTYTVIFDNSYSYFKSKRIQYFIEVTKHSTAEEIEKGADELLRAPVS